LTGDLGGRATNTQYTNAVIEVSCIWTIEKGRERERRQWCLIIDDTHHLLLSFA
jgi:hypothetical protein